MAQEVELIQIDTDDSGASTQLWVQCFAGKLQ